MGEIAEGRFIGDNKSLMLRGEVTLVRLWVVGSGPEMYVMDDPSNCPRDA